MVSAFCSLAFLFHIQVYTGEIAQKNIRGALGSFFQLLITIGILMVYVLGSFLSAKKTSFICGIVPILFGFCLLFCPESPTYLVSFHLNYTSRSLSY